MARSGKKSILLDVKTPDDIEYFINLAMKKGKGLNLNYQYRPGNGLVIEISGPRDRIMALEHLLRDAWATYSQDQ